MMNKSTAKAEKTLCDHCSEICTNGDINSGEKNFCCFGCKTVYELINESGLCEYYELSDKPGTSQRITVREGKFAFLDNREIAESLIHFSHAGQNHVTFYLPQMHCSSCIWLLEHLPRLDPGIVSSKADFMKREITVVFNAEKISLREVAVLLTKTGYEPHISLSSKGQDSRRTFDRKRIYKLGIAGFCFGNIMLLSFPEYLSAGETIDPSLNYTFRFLCLALSIPVLLYCASGFFTSAYKSIRQRFLNIDAPIALAILITFGRSLYEIITFTSAGYLDSMSGIVFFMLVGRYFQDKTYDSLSFDRDYTSFFPIGITVIDSDGKERQEPANSVQQGNRIRIHSGEIVPADGILVSGRAVIDYSFVSGESQPVEINMGEIIYAGGRQTSGAIELSAVHGVSQSYLTQLWNRNGTELKSREKHVSFVHKVSRWFTYILFCIAASAAAYWYIYDQGRIWNAVTAILIVACPCALLLSATFTNGSMMTSLQKAGFFIRSANALEGFADADTIVFDKTGTLSLQNESKIVFSNPGLTDHELKIIRSIAVHSMHPLSKAIARSELVTYLYSVRNFKEIPGKGCEALVNGVRVKMGSAGFACGKVEDTGNQGSRVYISINGKTLGYYSVRTKFRSGIETMIPALRNQYRLALLSGDNNSDEKAMSDIFGPGADLRFRQTPFDKLQYVKELQAAGHKVIMVGDGLNDAGALMQSDGAIAISDNANNFTPGCDAILEGKQFALLDRLLTFCRKEKKIIYGSFALSVIYNFAGLCFAVQGTLSPVIAAILMPASSVTIILYTTAISTLLSRKLKS